MYSNCLIEALKAKLKDPKNVQIFLAPKLITKKTHFMWTDGKTYCHSYNPGKCHWYNTVLHPSKTKKIGAYLFESYVLRYLRFQTEAVKKSVGKKLHLQILKCNSDWDWSLPNCRQELPCKEKIDFFEKVVKSEAKFKISQDGLFSVVNYNELKNLEGEFQWKWIGILDPDFERVFNKSSTTISDLQ